MYKWIQLERIGMCRKQFQQWFFVIIIQLFFVIIIQLFIIFRLFVIIIRLFFIIRLFKFIFRRSSYYFRR
jgi:hypothetical protein